MPPCDNFVKLFVFVEAADQWTNRELILNSGMEKLKKHLNSQSNTNKMTIKEQLVEIIKNQRISKGLTQSALAKRLGVSRNYISEVEKGTGSLSMKKVDEILLVLETKIEIKAVPFEILEK